jgi:imidazolonepropionase
MTNADFVLAPIAELHWNGAKMADAGIAFADGKIKKIGPAQEIIREYPEVRREPAGLVTPGLVDPHTHIVWGGNRADEFLRRCRGESYQEIAASGGGILSTMRATRSASVEELAAGIISRAKVMLSCGTTTLEVKASYGLSAEGCQKELDAIFIAKKEIPQRLIVTFMGAHAFPPEYSREKYIDILGNELVPMAAEHPVGCAFNDVFCEGGAFSVEESEKVLLAGLENGLRPKAHVDEFEARGGTQMACRLGAVSCDHLLASGPAEIEALAASQTVAVVLPGTAYYLGKPFADARAMLDAGCSVALGTDFNPGSSMVASMAFVMGLGVSKMGMSPEEALTAATAASGQAIGFDPFGAADLCEWPCDSLEELIYGHAFVRPSRVLIAARDTICD